MAGTLYVVATPIGNLQDISTRALQILSEVAVIAAEDTRHSGILLKQLGIATPMLSLHEHNEQARVKSLIERLIAGESIALISDAGTPLISDPGYLLVKAAIAAQITVVPIPGACAFIAALSAAGLPATRFTFEGFLPAKSGQRQALLQALQSETRTLIFYEAPHRLVDTLTDMAAIFGADRKAVLARELTKTFETIVQKSLDDLLIFVTGDPNQQKGEMVIIVEGDKSDKNNLALESMHVLTVLLTELPLKQAAHLAAKITGESKNKLYDAGLQLKK